MKRDLSPPPDELPASAEITLEAALGQGILEDLRRGLSSLDAGEETAPPPPRPHAGGGTDAMLEELAEDMLEVTRKLSSIEQSAGLLQARMDQADARSHEMGRLIAQQMDLLRRDLIGDKAALMARSLFNSIVSHIDSMVAMRADLENGKDRNDKNNKRLARQIEALELSLVTAVQGLGFYQFNAVSGDEFNASRMEALGFGDGKPGEVLKSIRPGFETKESVMRRAGVIISKPSITTH